jgi:single-stranded DNA-binding protein
MCRQNYQKAPTMTVYALASGTLFRAAEERVGKASGKTFVSATLKVRDGDAAQFLRLLAFSTTAQSELLRLKDGEALAVQGNLKAETYEKDGESRVSLAIMVNTVLPLRQKPQKREKRQPEPVPFNDDLPF